MKRTVPLDDIMAESLSDPEEARSYVQFALDEYLKDGDKAVFLTSLRWAVIGQGGFSKVARRAGLNRANLYEVLSKDGNPGFDTMMRILNALELSVEIVARKAPVRRTRKAAPASPRAKTSAKKAKPTVAKRASARKAAAR